MNITDFLLARISEDEAYANNARGLLGVETAWHEVDELRQRALTRADAQHVARWSAQRVLAECQAKRAIIELAEEASGLDASVDLDRAVGPRDFDAEPYVGDVILRQLAAVYADHPDYDETWRP